MPDPVTLAVLGGVAATEGIKFLYGQAAELLKAWRERREKIAAGEVETSDLTVPIITNDVLDSTRVQSGVNAEVVERESAALVELVGALSPYAQGLTDIDPTNQNLMVQVVQLRALLEAAYGQRLTFRGEQREPTGTRVTVKQAVGEVSGQLVGADVDVSTEAALDVVQDVTTVKNGGTVKGVTGNIGPKRF